MNEHDQHIIDAMRKYGGSFAKAVALAAMAADEENLEKIKKAFPELWAKYGAFLKLANVPDQQGNP